jgi:hypothetical protein
VALTLDYRGYAWSGICDCFIPFSNLGALVVAVDKPSSDKSESESDLLELDILCQFPLLYKSSLLVVGEKLLQLPKSGEFRLTQRSFGGFDSIFHTRGEPNGLTSWETWNSKFGRNML